MNTFNIKLFFKFLIIKIIFFIHFNFSANAINNKMEKIKILKTLSISLNSFDSLFADFVEFKLKKNNNFNYVADGVLLFKNSLKNKTKLRISYHGNRGQFLICNGQNILIKQKTDVYPLVIKLSQWPLRHIFRRPIYLENFINSKIIIDINKTNEMTSVKFTPLNTQGEKLQYKLELTFSGKNNIFNGWTIYTSDSCATKIVLSKHIFNKVISDTNFDIKHLRPKEKII